MSQYGALGMAKGGSTAAQILTHFYTGGAAVTAVGDNVQVRVNILHAASSFTLGSRALATGGGQIEVIVNGLPYVLGTAADAWTVSAAGTLVSVKKNGVSIGSGTTVGIYWAGTRNSGVAGAISTVALVNGKPYKYGNIDARVVSGKLEVVNPVLVHDEYLRGIAEMPSSWPAAALQAQVIAARSYAMSKLSGLRAACVCNVYGSTLDQVFAGYTKESSTGGAQWVAAVTATEPTATTGSAMTYKGSIITAYYFSSSGGRTQNSEDVWVAAKQDRLLAIVAVDVFSSPLVVLIIATSHGDRRARWVESQAIGRCDVQHRRDSWRPAWRRDRGRPGRRQGRCREPLRDREETAKLQEPCRSAIAREWNRGPHLDSRFARRDREATAR
jgi:hypothetical protein